MIRARLTDRHGAFVGYCDVPEQTAKDLPALPEVICVGEVPVIRLRTLMGRIFVRDPRTDTETSRSVVPAYREATFDCAENFRGTAVPVGNLPAAGGA